LLARISLAARGDQFTDNLRQEGLVVPDRPDVFDLVVAFSSAVDRHLGRRHRRSDLGEMAEMAAVAALTNQLGQRSAGLVTGLLGGGVRAVLAPYCTVSRSDSGSLKTPSL
jgi:hypothetical protein